MITLRLTADIKADRLVVLTLPAEVPPGITELEVHIKSAQGSKIPDWEEKETGRDGAEDFDYPLRGSVLRYDRPTDPVAEEDWEALQ